MSADKNMNQPCYCYSEKAFSDCCEVFLNKTKFPETPEQLMRSRFSAFVLKQIPYIESTMRGKALQRADLQQTQLWIEQVHWKNLTIINSEITDQTNGTVHFVAEYEEQNQPRVLEEISQFKKIDGRWYYVQGKHVQQPNVSRSPKVGRNEPCPCASGKKFKQCCGR